ncbi:40S ribosomal protein S27-2 [Cinnamomum micranthum f. kanehirae]|uniref:40S ribosomal protein S27-2 n=1 Tax=Cinnamomum micranthum f. kanehirae TaxID=337451 RepID=A0A443PJG1_9MAGN|nr:40S ribosomal protein S27-2 [Cinnamomum micranthum f. kanehirae]
MYEVACLGTSLHEVLPNDIDLLNPPTKIEKRRHKLKRLVQSPNSFFMTKRQSFVNNLEDSNKYAGDDRLFVLRHWEYERTVPEVARIDKVPHNLENPPMTKPPSKESDPEVAELAEPSSSPCSEEGESMQSRRPVVKDLESLLFGGQARHAPAPPGTAPDHISASKFSAASAASPPASAASPSSRV